MFARAGISSRVLRNGGAGGIFGRPKKKKEKTKFKCYVPFMWPACISVCVGFVILLGGTSMCVAGYYAGHFTSVDVSNGTHVWQEVNRRSYFHLHNFIYVGPVLMGFGSFIIVIACVVVCETRDKMLKIMAEQKAKGAKFNTKPDFYELVINNIKKGRRPRKSLPKQNLCVPGEERHSGDEESPDNVSKCRRRSLLSILFRKSSIRSTKSEPRYSHIGGALRNIPMQIFTIDVSQRRGTSLLPVDAKQQSHQGLIASDSSMGHKYPSASCLHDLLKMNDDKLSTLFPDQSVWQRKSEPTDCLNSDRLGAPFDANGKGDNEWQSLHRATVHMEAGGHPADDQPENAGNTNRSRDYMPSETLNKQDNDAVGSEKHSKDNYENKTTVGLPSGDANNSGHVVVLVNETKSKNTQPPIARGSRRLIRQIEVEEDMKPSIAQHSPSKQPDADQSKTYTVVHFDESITKHPDNKEVADSRSQPHGQGDAPLANASPPLSRPSPELCSGRAGIETEDDFTSNEKHPDAYVKADSCTSLGKVNNSFEGSLTENEEEEEEELNPLLDINEETRTTTPKKAVVPVDKNKRDQCESLPQRPSRPRTTLSSEHRASSSAKKTFVPYPPSSSTSRAQANSSMDKSMERSTKVSPTFRDGRSTMLENIRSSYLQKLRTFTRHSFPFQKPPSKTSSGASKHVGTQDDKRPTTSRSRRVTKTTDDNRPATSKPRKTAQVHKSVS